MSDKKIDYLDLNQESVLSIYKECLIPKENLGKNPQDEYNIKIFTKETCGKDSPEVVFNGEKIVTNTYTIAHLLGQLKVAHDRCSGFTLPMGFIKYDNAPWTKDNATLMALYYLGVATDFIPMFQKVSGSDKVLSTALFILPTFPKNHPKFMPLIDKEPTSLDDDQ